MQELAPVRARVAELESQLASLSTNTARVAHESELHERGSKKVQSTDEAPQESELQGAEVLRWRISAIEKFVPLTDEQKERLRLKYEAESAQQAGEAATERLDDIIGEENARFYRQQVKAAFQKVQDEETAKEALWLARSLRLSEEQEQAVLSVFREVEQQVDQESDAAGEGIATSPQDRVKGMIAENKKRAELRAQRLKNLLSAEQFEIYLKAAAESSSADVEVFHDPQ
jgi:hypothetical protein